MKWLLLASVWVLFSSCVNSPESDKENARVETPIGGSSVPTLFTELDSIVFNQLDFAYRSDQLSALDPFDTEIVIYSEKARSMLTKDTSLFLDVKSYAFGNNEGYDALYVKTKFNPKGWYASFDRNYDIACKTISDTSGFNPENWFVKRQFDDTDGFVCNESDRQFSVSMTLYIYHFLDLGFSFDPMSQLGGYDGGKVRIYYWR
jgi:hypothetical protein